MGSVWVPQGAMYGRWGPEVGGSELYGGVASFSVFTCPFPLSSDLLELTRDGLGVGAPGRDVRQMGPRGRRVGVVWRDRFVERLDVPVPLVRQAHAGLRHRRAVGEYARDDNRGGGRAAGPQP